MTDYYALAAFIVITGAAATTGTFFMPGPWYDRLAKPSWTPPKWAFPVVWTILYAMIAIAGWLVWRKQGIGLLVGVWAIQLVLNAAWSYIMFGRRDIRLALVDAGGMWLSIAAFIVLAWPVSQFASLLFVPYLIWVTIAFALNYEIVRTNPST